MGALAAEKILKSGKSKVLAILGNQALSITHRREAGFKSVTEKNTHISLSCAYCENETQAFDTIMKMPAESLKDLAVFCMSDELLCGVMQGFYERKVSIPGDVGVLAMSNGFFPRLFNPPISYVETSGYQLGKLSFTCMVDLIGGVEYLSEVMLRGGYIENSSL
jgi:LacI family transcriptional regulator